MNNSNTPFIPKLVAHRGYAKNYPENTFSAIEAAVNCGACYIEIDIQFTCDGIAVLLHDESLLRMTGQDVLITEIPFTSLNDYPVISTKYPALKNTTVQIPPLDDIIQYLKNIDDVILFVEIKEESLEKFGTKFVVDKLLEIIKPLQDRAVLISYHSIALEYAKKYKQAIGWVVKKYTKKAHETVKQLNPDYLFCNVKKVTPTDLWRGNWQWALYEITDPEQAIQLANNGIDLIETMAIGDMLKHPLLKQQRCRND